MTLTININMDQTLTFGGSWLGAPLASRPNANMKTPLYSSHIQSWMVGMVTVVRVAVLCAAPSMFYQTVPVLSSPPFFLGMGNASADSERCSRWFCLLFLFMPPDMRSAGNGVCAHVSLFALWFVRGLEGPFLQVPLSRLSDVEGRLRGISECLTVISLFPGDPTKF